MTGYKNGLYKLYTWGHYTLAQMRMMTCENGTNKKSCFMFFVFFVKIPISK